MSKLAVIILTLSCWTRLYSQTVSVSATKATLFYQWLENPISAVVENYSCKDVVVKVDKGLIKGSGCELIYLAASDTIHFVTISVGIKKKNKIAWISETRYPVKKLPDPVVTFQGIVNGSVPLNRFRAAEGLITPDPNEVCFTYRKQVADLKSYSVKVIRNDSTLFQEDVEGTLFSSNFKAFVNDKIQIGDKIVFDNFVTTLYTKEFRKVKQKVELTLE